MLPGKNFNYDFLVRHIQCCYMDVLTSGVKPPTLLSILINNICPPNKSGKNFTYDFLVRHIQCCYIDVSYGVKSPTLLSILINNIFPPYKSGKNFNYDFLVRHIQCCYMDVLTSGVKPPTLLSILKKAYFLLTNLTKILTITSWSGTSSAATWTGTRSSPRCGFSVLAKLQNNMY